MGAKLSDRLTKVGPIIVGSDVETINVKDSVRELEARLEAAEAKAEIMTGLYENVIRTRRIEELEWVLKRTVERDAAMWFGNRVLENIEERIEELKAGKKESSK
jgi:microcompartment protein CcmL/EutN